MPRVGDRQFAYTDAGRREAELYSRQVGLPVEEDGNPNVYQSMTRRIQGRRPGGPLPAGPPVNVPSPRWRRDQRADQRVGSPDRDRAMQDEVRLALDRLSPADRRDPSKQRAVIAGLNRRGREQSGRWGYPGETRREHYDREWDRDWDEDVRGRRWNPKSAVAGER